MLSNCCSICSDSDEAALILIRHGESLWNEKNLFTGCVDVPLSKKGIDEAIEAGQRISSIPVDVIFTSALIRAQMTAMLAMTQHRRGKVTQKDTYLLASKLTHYVTNISLESLGHINKHTIFQISGALVKKTGILIYLYGHNNPENWLMKKIDRFCYACC